MKIVDESTISEKGYMTRWLLGSWNSESNLDFGIAYFQPNQQVKKHIHEEVEEIFYVIEGEIVLELDNDECHILKKGIVAHIPPNQPHSLHNQTKHVAKFVVIKYPSNPSDKKYLE